MISIILSILTTMEILIGLYFGVPTDDHDIESEKNKAFWVGLAAMVFNICMYAGSQAPMHL